MAGQIIGYPSVFGGPTVSSSLTTPVTTVDDSAKNPLAGHGFRLIGYGGIWHVMASGLGTGTVGD